MSIGTLKTGGFSFASFSVSKNDTTTDIKSLLKTGLSADSSSSSSSENKATAPRNSFTGEQQAAKTITKSDLESLKNKISAEGGQGADQIDQLIQNFDQYDTTGSGSISLEKFKEYASANGVTLPEQQHHHHHRPSPAAATGTQSSSADTDTKSAVPQAAVAGFLGKYAAVAAASGAQPASTDTSTTTPTAAAGAGSDSSKASGTDTTSSSSEDVSSESTAELESAAASGDTAAQAELARREAAGTAKDTSRSSSTPPTAANRDDQPKVDVAA